MATSSNGSTNSSKKQRRHAHAQQPHEIDQYVDHFLSLMCDSSRRHILELLAAINDKETAEVFPEKRSSDIAKELGLSPATTSGHLRQLFQAKLVTCRREGNTIYYQLANSMLVRTFHDLVNALHQEYTGKKNFSTREMETS